MNSREIDEIEIRNKKAFSALHEACENKFTLTAHIPPNHDVDHDLLISDSLNDVEKLIAYVRRLEEVKEAADLLDQMARNHIKLAYALNELTTEDLRKKSANYQQALKACEVENEKVE